MCVTEHHVERLTSFAPQELFGQPVDLLLGAELLSLASGTRVETTCRRRDGSLVPVEAHVGTIEGEGAVEDVPVRRVEGEQVGRLRGGGDKRGRGRLSFVKGDPVCLRVVVAPERRRRPWPCRPISRSPVRNCRR